MIKLWKRKKISPEFRGQIQQIIKSWNTIPDEVSVYWRDMPLDVLGCFSVFTPNAIYLNSRHSSMPGMLIPTAAHELCHRIQFKRHPFWYLIESIPGIREFCIEPGARGVEEMIEREMQKH